MYQQKFWMVCTWTSLVVGIFFFNLANVITQFLFVLVNLFQGRHQLEKDIFYEQ